MAISKETKAYKKKSKRCPGCKEEKDVEFFHKSHNKPHGYCKICDYKRKDVIYGLWANVIDRCYNEKNIAYHLYGGRGVTVCKEWRDSFKLFKNWCLNNGWQKGLHLDKDIKAKELGIEIPIYCPELCQFVTPSENFNNRRVCVTITCNGKSQTIMQWSKETGIPYNTLRNRYNYGNWDIERVLTKINQCTNEPY